ncbi:MAG TPA: cysteine hydrolase [Candidatus Magasanikbacteria bacterium]|nr:cysteine hydrolase [Candidatus Magasanikbacteria bacterium]
MIISRKNTALLLIDFQRDFCEKDGYAYKFSGNINWVKPILPKAKKLLDFARKNKLFIIHTREGYKRDLSDCDKFRLERSKTAGAQIGSKGPMGRLLICGEHGQDIIDLLKPIKGEKVLDKSSYGAFATTSLKSILKKQNITHLILCGVTADVCVHTTLREATDLGFYCYYVKDAISSPDASLRKACERMIEAEGGVWGKLVDTETILKSNCH